MRKAATILGVYITYFLFGVIGGSIFCPFSDLLMESNPFIHHVIGGAILLFGGIIVGVLINKYWYLAGGCAWFALLLACGHLLSLLKAPISSIYFIKEIVTYMILPIAISLLGGYIGFRIRDRLFEIRSWRI